jgi:acetoin utilization protein AcuB
MIAGELINQMIPPLKFTDTVQKALQWMEELHVNQLPVINKSQYKGLLTEENIYEHSFHHNALIEEIELIYANTYVFEYQHFYDILKIANRYHLYLVAVLDKNEHFLGAVTLNDTLLALAESSFMQEAGSILVFSMDKRDYTLSEISRLVESENAKILSTYVSDDKTNPYKINVTIKVNISNLNRLIATFERFNYNIISKFQDGSNEDFEQERLDNLLKFLNI